MRIKTIVDTTTCSATYKQAHKIYLSTQGKIDCCLCPYHKGENHGPKRSRSWKDATKRQKQWKIKG